MDYLIVIVLIVCTYFIVKTIKEHSPEGQDKKLLNKIDSYKERIMFLRDQIIQKEPDFIENSSIKELRQNLFKMDEKYHSLINRNKADYKKILEWTEDWNKYLSALHSLKMAECIVETNLSDNSIDDYKEKIIEPNKIKKDIEKKFNDLLK